MRRSSLDALRLALLGALIPAVSTGCTGPVASELPPEQPQASDEEGGSPPASDDDGGKQPPEPAPDLSCEGDTLLTNASGAKTGFAQCEDGSLHRVEAVACTVPDPTNACPGGKDVEGDCKADADCTARPHGRCITYQPMMYHEPEKVFCGCQYSCETDADCGEGQACICPGSIKMGRGSDFPSGLPQCIPAECATDTDCASRECGAAVYNNGCYEDAALKCRTPGDACRTDDACKEGESCVAAERYAQGSNTPTREWQCAGMSCVIGRPLLVEGEARVAELRAGPVWSRAPEPAAIDDPVRRSAIARHWREVARLEHASVASFARFVQQLLALGAPAPLVRDALAAMRDEVEHARLCFGLAAAHGESATPARLELEDAEPATEPLEVAAALLREACLGETLGVAEAMEAAQGCADPVTRTILRRIADDETRHAQLAWRTLAWLVERASPDERAALERLAWTTLTEIRDALAAPAPGEAPDCAEAGIPGPEQRRATHRAALREVVEPCLRAVFA